MKLTSSPPAVVQPGIFVVPARAQLRSVTNETTLAGVWKEVGQWGKCLGYPKPDGWRMQIHKLGHEVYLFSRSGKDWTAEFPTVVQTIRDRVSEEQAILDTELVGFDVLGSHLGPSKLRHASRYRCYLLDALYLQAQSLVYLPTKERIPFIQKHLHQAFDSSFTLAEHTPLHSNSDLANLYQQYRARQKEGFDGIIIKQLEASYFTDAFKLKPEETIDAVVVGAYLNKQQEIKTLLLAVPCHERNSWIPITKVARTSIDWHAVWSACKPHVRQQRPDHLEDPPAIPDIWIDPQVVVTIAVTSLETSKCYQIHASAARGCVLREDKSPKEATSFGQILQMANLDESSNNGNSR